MATAQEKVDAIATRSNSTLQALSNMLTRRIPRIADSLPIAPDKRVATATQMVRVLLNTAATNPYILRCSLDSIIAASYEAAAVNLPLDGVLGHAYIVPYKVKGVYRAQMQIGYRGFAELAWRSGKITISASEVCDNDRFEAVDDLHDPVCRFSKCLKGERGEMYCAYAMAGIPGGRPLFTVLRQDEIEKRREASSSFKFGKESPWRTHPEAMWRKTAIRALAALLPQSPEAQRAAQADELRDMGMKPFAAFTAESVEVVRAEAIDGETVDAPEGDN